jgi:cytochrome b subunit of formate dehydrogenase
MVNTQQVPQPETTPRYYFRHSLFQRLMHGVLMPTFVGLAATGLPLKFSHAGWSRSLASAIGGFDAILFFHKALAALLTLLMVVPVVCLFHFVFVTRHQGVLWGATSITPQPRDVQEMLQHFRYFFGLASEPPRFGRYTYWEKFDYLAVFWGMAIIGGSGFLMWFSEFFAKFLPGSVFNAALIIHSEEALLAVWFIFTVHIFNSHLRPQKFPMDMVIFTGRETIEELAELRPAEYERLVAAGELEMHRAPAPPDWLRNFGRLVGLSIVVAGITVFLLTVVAIIG